jgi:hypothetical protein
MTLPQALIRIHDELGDRMRDSAMVLGYLSDWYPENSQHDRRWRQYRMILMQIGLFQTLFDAPTLPLAIESLDRDMRKLGLFKRVRDWVIDVSVAVLRADSSRSDLFESDMSFANEHIACHVRLGVVERQEHQYRMDYDLTIQSYARHHKHLRYYVRILNRTKTRSLGEGMLDPTASSIVIPSKTIIREGVHIEFEVHERYGWFHNKQQRIAKMNTWMYLGGI